MRYVVRATLIGTDQHEELASFNDAGRAWRYAREEVDGNAPGIGYTVFDAVEGREIDEPQRPLA